jgi:hypothetical protein
VVTFAEFRDADLAGLSAAADAWDRLAGHARGLEQRVNEELKAPLRASGWGGNAAEQAMWRLDRLHDEFDLAGVQTRNLAGVLRAAYEELDRLHRNLLATIRAAQSVGLTVGADGWVDPPSLPMGEHANQQLPESYHQDVANAASYTDAIASILAQAGDADSRYNGALREFGPVADGVPDPWDWNRATTAARDAAQRLGFGPDTIPAPGADPAAVRTWWAGLTPDQQNLLATAYPDRVGALDGLPATARDQANRLALHDFLGDQAIHATDPADPHSARAQHLLDKLAASDDAPAGQRLYLLGIDEQGDGKAVVAVGNPDTAAHTAVLVPGVGTNLDHMAGQIDRATRIQAAATQMHNGDVAVVAWLGYDPPQINESLPTAVVDHRADAGAVPLDNFVSGLRAAHNASPDHITAIGHSYGSLVIGDAASHGHHLAVDDIVTAGSPGMGVDHATDLGVDPHHVWVGAAPDDPISGTAGFVHGTAPQDSSFGANQYRVDTHGHSGYWDENSDSLTNQARVVSGSYDRVALDHGNPPP